MARPTLDPQRRRSETLNLRLVPTEMYDLRRRAAEAGVTLAEYARATLTGRRPKPKPVKDRMMSALLYELSSIATNLSQLEDVTGDANFAKWARYVGGDLVERVTDRHDLAPLIEEHLEAINGVGHMINAMARRANVGKDPDPGEVEETLSILGRVLEPVHKAVKRPAGGGDKEPDPGGGRDAL
ncbi:MAG: plasmid mobilization protein [Ferrovibrio sp.]|uniref:plasmid mobilization protein n=1 Tax=Ferrovibrio sp. TaxID=1917215 RepID=UPI00391A1E00